MVVADNVDHCKMTNQWPGTVPGAVILIYRDGTHWRRERKGEAEGRRRKDLGGCTAKVREKGRGREMEITEEGSGGEGIPFFFAPQRSTFHLFLTISAGRSGKENQCIT